MHASRPANPIVFHLIILIICEENKLWSSLICLFLYCMVIFSARLPPRVYSEFLHRFALSLKNHKSPASLPQVKLIVSHLTPPPSLCDVSVWTGPGTGTARRHQSWLVVFLKRLVLLTQRKTASYNSSHFSAPDVTDGVSNSVVLPWLLREVPVSGSDITLSILFSNTLHLHSFWLRIFMIFRSLSRQCQENILRQTPFPFKYRIFMIFLCHRHYINPPFEILTLTT
jgi:hypothetical protein